MSSFSQLDTVLDTLLEGRPNALFRLEADAPQRWIRGLSGWLVGFSGVRPLGEGTL